MSIHPTALIDPDAKLGENVEVGPYSIVSAGVEVGDGNKIGPHVVIHPFVKMGEGNTIHAGAVIGDVPQDYAFDINKVSYVEIGNHNSLREGFTIHRGTEEGSVTRIGNHCLCMANSHMGHNAVLGDHVILANGVLLAGHVEVGDKVFLAGNVVVHQFVRIGRLAMASGVAGLSQDLPPFCMHHGAEINKVSGLNTVGLRRAGFSAEERKQIKQAFHILYSRDQPQKEAIEKIRAEIPEGPAWELADFADSSKRGIGRLRK